MCATKKYDLNLQALRKALTHLYADNTVHVSGPSPDKVVKSLQQR